MAPKSNPNPNDWKTVKLGEIFTPQQIGKTIEIIQQTPNDTARTNRLREYYKTFETELSAKGFVVDYLVYAVPYWIERYQEDIAQREAKEAAEITESFFKDKRN